jgi:LuxR family maltose regulon positive regulatory protein
MGLAAKRAAPRKRRPLPLLTSEYLQGISTFTLRYFEELYSRLNPPQPHHNPPTAILKKENPPYPPFAKVGKGRFAFAKGSKGGFIIVFDNYHEVPANSPFHEIILNGLSQILEGINVILISRSDPPPALIRLRANRQMEILRWNDLRLTLEESEGIWIPMETLWSRKTCIPSVPKNLLGNFCMARANGKESRVAAKLWVLRAPNQ